MGATHAQTEWLCFLDDDVRPAIGFFDEAVSFLDRNDWIDVLQPELLQHDSWTEYRSSPDEWIQNYHSIEKKSRETPARSLDAVQWFLQKPGSCFDTLALSIGSGAFFIKREPFLRVGGFDENLLGSGDDRELIVRLWWYGYRTYFFPKCVAFHLHDKTGGLRSEAIKNTLSNIIRPEPDPGIIYFYQKWFPGYPSACFYLYYLLKHKNHFLLPIRILRLLRAASLANELIKKGPQYCLGVSPRHRESLDAAKCDFLQNTTLVS
jgi:GT2 family glycosyltransferase